MDNVAFQAQEGTGYNPWKLLITIERDGAKLCSFKGRCRVTNAQELLLYLGFLIALGVAAEHAENEPVINGSEVAA